MKEKTVAEFKQMLDSGEDFQLIDVRESYEYDIANLGGELIPMGSLMEHSDKISRDKPVIIHCRSGARSAAVINQLEKTGNFNNLFNLKGGILAYAREIDPSLPTY